MEELINNKRELNVLVPDGCGVCGIKTIEWIKENKDIPWLKIDLMPGISLFKCPNCSAAYFNPNALNNHFRLMAWSKEDSERRIHLAGEMPKVVPMRTH